MEDNKKILSINYLTSDKKYEQEKIFFEDNYESFINKVCNIFQIDDKYKDYISVTFIPEEDYNEEREISNESEYQNLLNIENQFINLNIKLNIPSNEIKCITNNGTYETTPTGNNNIINKVIDNIYNSTNNYNESNNEIIKLIKTEINNSIINQIKTIIDKKFEEIIKTNKDMLNNIKNDLNTNINNYKIIETNINNLNNNLNELNKKVTTIQNKISYNSSDDNNFLEENLNKKFNEIKKNYNDIISQQNNHFEKLYKKFDNINILNNNNNYGEKLKVKKFFLDNNHNNNNILNTNNNEEEDIKENSIDNLNNRKKNLNFEQNSNFEDQQNDSKSNYADEEENMNKSLKKNNEFENDNKYQIDYEGVQKSFPFSFLEKGFCDFEIKITNNGKTFLPKDCYLCQILPNNKKDGLMFKNTLINDGEEIAPNQQVKVKIKLLPQENFVKQNDYVISYEIKEHQLIQLNKEQSGLSQISFTGIVMNNRFNNNNYKYGNQNFNNTPFGNNNNTSNYKYKNTSILDRNNKIDNNKKGLNIINNDNIREYYNKYNLNSSNNNQKNKNENLNNKYSYINQRFQNLQKPENFENKEYNIPLNNNNNKNRPKSQYKFGSSIYDKYEKYQF